MKIRSVTSTHLGLCFALLFGLTFPTTLFATEQEDRDLERDLWLATDAELPALELRISRIMQTDPKSSFAHYLMANLFLKMYSAEPTNTKYLKQAAQLSQEVIDLDSKDDFGFIATAQILDITGQQENALKVLDDYVTMSKKATWRIYFLKARLKSDQVSTEETLAMLEKALSESDAIKPAIVPYVIAILRSQSSGEELATQLDSWNKKFPDLLFEHNKAIALSQDQHFEEAHKLYSQIEANNPSFYEAKINDGIILYSKLGKPEQASALFEEVKNAPIKITGNTRSVALTHLGIVNIQEKKFDQAETNFIAALKLHNQYPDIVAFIVRAYRDNKASNQLLSFMMKLNEEIPGESSLHAFKGEILLEDLSDPDKAIFAYKDAIALEPNKSEYYTALGLTYYKKKDWDKALSEFAAAIEVNPEDAVAYYNEACVLALTGKEDKAMTSLKRAIQLDPTLQHTAKDDKDFAGIREKNNFQILISNTTQESYKPATLETP
ncbi:MAG: tetratricopeptide repeat protein [Oligoflexales bacterium]